MNNNPYQSPNVGDTTFVKTRKWRHTLYVIAMIGLGISSCILSRMNALQEPSLPPNGIWILTIFPIVLVIPGLIAAGLYKWKPNPYSFLFILPAICVSLLTTLVFSVYVIAGPFRPLTTFADFRRNLFQVHPIALPFTFTAIAVVLYFVTSLAALGTLIFRLGKRRLRNPESH